MTGDPFPLRLYTLEEAAAIMKVSKRTILRRIQTGSLGCFRDGHMVRVTDEHLLDYLRAAEQRPSDHAGLVERGTVAPTRLHPQLFAGSRRGTPRPSPG